MCYFRTIAMVRSFSGRSSWPFSHPRIGNNVVFAACAECVAVPGGGTADSAL